LLGLIGLECYDEAVSLLSDVSTAEEGSNNEEPSAPIKGIQALLNLARDGLQQSKKLEREVWRGKLATAQKGADRDSPGELGMKETQQNNSNLSKKGGGMYVWWWVAIVSAVVCVVAVLYNNKEKNR
jgi:hypothetical protein